MAHTLMLELLFFFYCINCCKIGMVVIFSVDDNCWMLRYLVECHLTFFQDSVNFCLIKKLFMFIDNVDLGTACGKYYRVCCLSIIDPGMGCCFSYFIKIRNWFWCFCFSNAVFFYFFFQVILISSRHCLANNKVVLELHASIFSVVNFVFIMLVSNVVPVCYRSSFSSFHGNSPMIKNFKWVKLYIVQDFRTKQFRMSIFV